MSPQTLENIDCLFWKKKQTNKQNKTKQETKQSNEQDMAPMNQLVKKKEIYGYFTYSISV